jgi:Uma2 family endonuclease
MSETDFHYLAIVRVREMLDLYYAGDSMVYVSGNLLVFYEPGNRRRHISPDIFVVKGVPRRRRLNYLIWREGKAPDVVFEFTSPSTREEDLEDKFELYQNVLRVQEYLLFDPLAEYLDPPLQGYRLRRGRYASIPLVDHRLPSKVLGLHLERQGQELRLYNPATERWLPTLAEAAREAEAARRQAEAEIERLQRELAKLRRQRKE